MAYERLVTGATAIGLRTKGAVILAAEKRVSYGGFIMSRAGRKVFLIKDRYGVAFAGLFADIQTLKRLMNVEIHSYEIENGRPITVRSAARLLSVILYQYKLMPFLSEVIFGGIDSEGVHLYVMDSLGSLIEDDYAAIGTGAPVAIGIIESRYKKDMKVEDAEQLAIDAVKAAISRDAVSGDGVDVIAITHDKSWKKSIAIK
ncbi:MAG: proteasome endopeptidase complex, archaeal, beta subunit [Candidatus Hecatellales archaeon]|nr:MAG: proteasome endopeptidase complex, archaeal, beta subunit [Candidatus Hecatellales archaeon]